MHPLSGSFKKKKKPLTNLSLSLSTPSPSYDSASLFLQSPSPLFLCLIAPHSLSIAAVSSTMSVDFSYLNFASGFLGILILRSLLITNQTTGLTPFLKNGTKAVHSMIKALRKVILGSVRTEQHHSLLISVQQ